MFAPLTACELLAQEHKWLRLCWVGRPRKYAGELNPGSFGICQLYHILDIGSIENPKTFRELWDVTTIQKEDGGFATVRTDRGTLFNTKATSEPDYPIYQRVPVFVATFEDFGDPPIPTQAIFDGSFIFAIRQWLKPIEQRVMHDAQRRVRWMNSMAEDAAEARLDRSWWEANQTSETGPRIAKEFRKKEIEAAGLAGEKGIDFSEEILPPKPVKEKK